MRIATRVQWGLFKTAIGFSMLLMLNILEAPNFCAFRNTHPRILGLDFCINLPARACSRVHGACHGRQKFQRLCVCRPRLSDRHRPQVEQRTAAPTLASSSSSHKHFSLNAWALLSWRSLAISSGSASGCENERLMAIYDCMYICVYVYIYMCVCMYVCILNNPCMAILVTI